MQLLVPLIAAVSAPVAGEADTPRAVPFPQGDLCMRTAIDNPDAMHRLQSQSLEEGSNYPQDGPDQSTWTRVLVRPALAAQHM